MEQHTPAPAADARVRHLAARYGLPEDKVRKLLEGRAGDDALSNLEHFLRAPS